MATTNLEFDFAFKDNSITKLTFGPFAPTAFPVTAVKACITAFNQQWNANASWFLNFKNSNGYNPVQNNVITGGTVVTKEITDFNLPADILEKAGEIHDGEGNA